MSKKLKKPKVQEMRDIFFLKHALGESLMWHRGHQCFYKYQEGWWKPVQKDEMMTILDSFVLGEYGDTHEIDITRSTLEELYVAIQRDAMRRVRTIDENVISPRVAFRDQTFDFETFELLPHSPDNLALHHLDFDFPTSTLPTPAFDAYLTSALVDPDTFEHDEALASFVFDALAYYLTPVNSQPMALFVQGPGGNGKSVLLDLLAAIMGREAICSLSLDELSSRFGPAGLIGKRLNIVSEDPAKLADASKIKALISQELVSLEKKFADVTSFRPMAKHIFSTNKEIRFESIDEATTRRLFIVPFHRLFKPKGDPRIDGKLICEQDPRLIYNRLGVFKGKLIDELPGIMFRLIERLKQLAQNEYVISIPDQIRITKEESQSASSSALEFMHLHYKVDLKSEELIACDDIYAEYRAWFSAQGRGDKFLIQPRQFWGTLAKNMPETTTRQRVYREAKEFRAKTHLVSRIGAAPIEDPTF